MTIEIDGNEANVKEQVGVSIYTKNLLSYFQKWANDSLSFSVYLKNHPLEHMPGETTQFQYHVTHPSFLWSRISLPLHLVLSRKNDVFFSPAHYAPRFGFRSLVVTIHDLSYFYYPHDFMKKDLYKLTNWTRESLQKAKKVIAVSQTTKKDIMKFYNIPQEKIEVIYNGYEKKILESRVKNLDLIKNLKLRTKNYILYVGTLQPRKNISLLIDAYSEFVKKYSDYKLVLVGKKGWLYEKIFKKVNELQLQENVIFTGYIPDEEVIGLYQNAFCFVLPSLYEGFGIPLLEAMSNGCPVLSSFTSSLPEIGGEACLYFDPTQRESLLEKLVHIKENDDKRKELIKKGKERVKQFSWELCAKKTLEVLKSASIEDPHTYGNSNN